MKEAGEASHVPPNNAPTFRRVAGAHPSNLPLAGRSRKQASSFLESCPTEIGVAVLDQHFRFITVNAALARMNGLPVKAHYEKGLRDVLGSVSGRVERALAKVFENRLPLLYFEIKGKLPYRSATSSWVEHYVPIIGDCGVVRAVGVLIAELGYNASQSMSDGYMKTGVDFNSLKCCENELYRLVAQVSGKPKRLAGASPSTAIATTRTSGGNRAYGTIF